MSGIFAKIAEEKIREAIRNGEFDNLPARGKPINLDDWASLPVEIRLGYTLLKNTGYAPEEVQLLKEIAELREQLTVCPDHDEKKRIRQKLRELETRYNLAMELRKRKK
ncbi:Domain of unknown function (DUF1992) [Acididesulfobacillus acetoxydans]|uniref:DnaJ homologue subfamily C member 28 conserved domain-containing protein n=1 Tax=Acididesulfobacillus acetoxydans TaxID=1561005 RepID=A0A8S0WM10_9FIRM|nr:DnaJ family domain-containing protein [Acididesulfobacillus acetoxydans]CAA7600294.1 Domain of unknown function (DUF1992) [Acididesulfobacillus acetoxydans]CEJ06070.1 Domain of unknown function (DUF1992) [Acididesulfobacillus acetoxydans]